ncbi:hypothetical protein Tco_0578195 [Tanacetum coccineum]
MSSKYQVIRLKEWRLEFSRISGHSKQWRKEGNKGYVFHKMKTEEISDRFVAPLKSGNKVVKKELVIALRGEIYFVKFILNPEEDDVEPGVVFRRSFLRLTKAIADFENETITIYPELDPFLDSAKEEENIGDDWDILLDDLDFGDIPNIEGVDVPQFVCKMKKSTRSKRKQLENYKLTYFDMGTSTSTGKPLTQEQDEREVLDISISERYSLLEEERPVIKTTAYSDKYKKILDGICLDKMKLYEMNKEEEEAIIKIKGEAYQCNAIQRAGQRGSTKCKEGDHNVKPLEGRVYGDSEQCSVPAKTSLDTAKSDNDDKEEYAIQRNKFRVPIYGPKPARYLNCGDPLDRSLALQEVLNPFRKICIWKKVVSFLGLLPVALQHVEWKPGYTGCFNRKEDSDGQWHAEIRLTDPYGNTMGTHDDKARSSRPKCSRQYKTVEEVLLPQVHHEFLEWEGCNRDAKSRYNTKLAHLQPRHIYSPCVVNWDILNRMGCGKEIDGMLRINLCEAGTNEEIFTSMAWIRDFNINELIYSELCHEFYSTYEFDDVCTDDELKTKKIIKFRLGGHAHSLTLLEFARRLGLYHAEELDEEGFDVYFQGGLRSDEHFNAQEYWLSISREENLSFSRSHTATIRNSVLRVLHKMITYGLCQRTTVYNKIQKNDLWLLSMFDARHQNGYANVAWLIIARKARVLSDEVIRSLSALIYCRDLDTTTLRELIDSEGRLILEAPQPDGVDGALDSVSCEQKVIRYGEVYLDSNVAFSFAFRLFVVEQWSSKSTSTLPQEKDLRYFSFGRHLDELHVTWAHLEKKRTRLRTNTKTLEDLYLQSLETASQVIHDAVTPHQVTASHHS